MPDAPEIKTPASVEVLPPDQRRVEIARLGGKARWADLPWATHDGPLKLGDAVIPAAVLNDKRRVLTQSGVMKALGRARQAKGRSYYDGDVNLPAFITAKNLKPFIPKELFVTSSQIEFRHQGGGKAYGYPAELLPKICGVFIDADEAGKLTDRQRLRPVTARPCALALAKSRSWATRTSATSQRRTSSAATSASGCTIGASRG
jgi:hypothetical protein